ncbi:ras, putative [Entamoeba invadens IP1]|uniref:Ras, putative n=1 Tax=Entamoeba invadens IP1 TaxID=370355 RepID=L7FL83_ENTIV|nr:ras, putative [Entamoeba invadens IP1]ELP87711.1 ras, putative [Entamoeba invadens IP1]|eukprot:XP_004254482.1 ras, putative [Entamoeba invadens IP1]
MYSNVVVLGTSQVGKTVVIKNFVSEHNNFGIDVCMPEETYVKSLAINNELIIVSISDTFPMMNNYNSVKDNYIKTCDGFVLMHSITSFGSFEAVKTLYDEIYEMRNLNFETHIPIVMCGNKSDLESDREVPTDEANRVAQFLDIHFFETSAKSNTNIKEMFIGLLQDVQRNKTKQRNEKQSSNKHTKGCKTQ